MINIRTITYNLDNKFTNKNFNIIEKCMAEWTKSKYNIRTVRINTPVINKMPNIKTYDKLNDFCVKNHIKWFNIPVIITNKNNLYDFSYNMIKKYDKAYINIDGVINKNIDIYSIDSYISLMKKVSLITTTGEENFRLGLSINTKENTPFFPFSKSSGEFNFSIGLELTQEINKIINNNLNKNLNEIRKIIIKKLDKQITKIENYALYIEEKYNIPFKGFDFSLAPIVEDNCSIGGLISKLGIKNFNGPGTLFITAYLTNIIKYFGNTHREIGFSGIMYSLLEDTVLSNINNTTGIKLEDIIKLSAMCGCGIDMIPIYRNVDNEIIKSYILDICAISCKLDKPLGVRFIPQDNNLVYTKIKSNKDFITNTKILNLVDNRIINNNLAEYKLLDIEKRC